MKDTIKRYIYLELNKETFSQKLVSCFVRTSPIYVTITRMNFNSISLALLCKWLNKVYPFFSTEQHAREL